MKTLLLLGNDKIAGEALGRVKRNESLHVYVDHSTNWRRIAKLLWKKSITPSLLLKMAVCEYARQGTKPASCLPPINSNAELLREIVKTESTRLVLFRAGLIINNQLLKAPVKIINIHAASIPEYGGIGSISKALQEGSLTQFACAHVVTKTIDRGLIIKTQPYKLDLNASYCQNERKAYNAAIQLLNKIVMHNNS